MRPQKQPWGAQSFRPLSLGSPEVLQPEQPSISCPLLLRWWCTGLLFVPFPQLWLNAHLFPRKV